MPLKISSMADDFDFVCSEKAYAQKMIRGLLTRQGSSRAECRSLHIWTAIKLATMALKETLKCPSKLPLLQEFPRRPRRKNGLAQGNAAITS